MTQLLLKDICARLPYKVKGIITYDESNTIFTVEGIDNNVLHLSNAEECCVEDFKPYLRPMSSMTEEEFYEYNYIRFSKIKDRINYERVDVGKFHNVGIIPIKEYIDWLNAHHFDYRGLIEKGFALEAPEGMYD